MIIRTLTVYIEAKNPAEAEAFRDELAQRVEDMNEESSAYTGTVGDVEKPDEAAEKKFR